VPASSRIPGLSSWLTGSMIRPAPSGRTTHHRRWRPRTERPVAALREIRQVAHPQRRDRQQPAAADHFHRAVASKPGQAHCQAAAWLIRQTEAGQASRGSSDGAGLGGWVAARDRCRSRAFSGRLRDGFRQPGILPSCNRGKSRGWPAGLIRLREHANPPRCYLW
jgi:hypothetical protein